MTVNLDIKIAKKVFITYLTSISVFHNIRRNTASTLRFLEVPAQATSLNSNHIFKNKLLTPRTSFPQI